LTKNRQKVISHLFLLFALFLVARKAWAKATTGVVHGTDVNKEIDPWPPATSRNPSVHDLFQEYNTIFRHGNRNAASHLWSTFLLDRASQMSLSRLRFFFSAFCSVSGSQVRPSDYNRYRLTLPLVGSNATVRMSGFMHYCCWPCVCDTQDFIRVDTRNVTSSDGVTRSQYFAVIGNPCDHPEQLDEPFEQPFSYARGRKTTLAVAAPELKCVQGQRLQGATVSDHGYIIIGMFFDASPVEGDQGERLLQSFDTRLQTPGRVMTMEVASTNTGDREGGSRSILYQDERDWEGQCTDRANHGYNSGMGEIFRRVSAISPIVLQAEALGSEAKHKSTHGIAGGVLQSESTGQHPTVKTGEDPTCEAPPSTDYQAQTS